jgi:hypothetical protein
MMRGDISAEMCFMRSTAGYTLSDHKRNEEIMKDTINKQQNLHKNTEETGKSMLEG